MNQNLIYQCNQNLTIELKQGTSLTVRQINSVFQSGLWRFESENQLIFQPTTSLFQRFFPLKATYKKLGKVYQFRAEQIFEFERAFLDGIIQIENESLILNGIYSLSTPSEPLQIARIVQKLKPTSLTIDEFEQYGEQARISSVESDENLATTSAELIQLEIDPIQIIKNYSVTLKGNTESDTFDSLEAILYITFPSEGEKPNNIQLTTKRISESTIGNFHWVCQPIEQCLDNDWYSLTEVNEDSFNLININLNYQEKIPTNNCTWYSKTGSDLKSNILPVMGEKITVNLTINGDLVTGNIDTSGYYIDSLASSTYQANVEGEIEKNNRVEELRQVLNSKNSNFTGCWVTEISAIGEIKLQQNNSQVRGTYHPKEEILECEIVGTAEDDFLEFHWTNSKEKGWGYFRSLNQGGILSGMWGIGDFPNQPQAVVANWQLPINVETAFQDDEIFLRELRWLGHQLIIEKRFEQGVTVLEEVLRLYRYQRYQWDISSQEKLNYLESQEELNYLHSEALTLVAFVLGANIYSGNYNKLISNLDHLIELIQSLGAEASASRLFKERTASVKKSIIDFQETCQFFIEGLERNKFLLENESKRGVTGISFDCEIEQSKVVINKVIKDSPAEAAGILPGDVLIQVGETKFKNFSPKECYDLLIGDPNTLINIVVIRKNTEITFDLIRKSYTIYPPHRQKEFINLIDYLERYYSDFIALTETEIERLERLNLEIAKGQIDFLEAWTILRNYLAVLEETTNSKIDNLLELKETLFVEYPSFLEDIKLATNFIIQLRENIRNQNSAIVDTLKLDDPNIIELDLRIENFFLHNSDLSQIETILFRTYLHSFQAVNDFCGKMNLEHDFMLRIDIVNNYQENQQSSRIMLSNLTHHIERWRGKLVEDLEKIDALEQAQPLFAKVLEMSVALGNAQEALIFSEKSRARAFADLLATRFKEDADRDLIDIPVTSPEITFEQIQHLAKSNSATIVEYFVVTNEESEVKIYIWAIQPNGATFLKTVELDSDSQQSTSFLSNLIMKARQSFGVKDSKTFSNSLNSSFSNTRDSLDIDLSTELENSQTLLAELYQLLIEPIESYLESSLTKTVIIVPHGNLFLLPFTTLLNPKTKQYLIEKYSVILSPSIQTLDLTQQNFASNSKAQDVLVVGNPKMPSFGEPPKPLAKLPYAETAAKAISNIFKTKPLLGDRATKHEVLTQLSSAKTIHFGTHGEFNPTQPLKGGIALASEGEEWGFLTVEEILGKFAPPQTASLNAELVVLSACSTGLGRITGDGVIGLARGLMAAGVKAVLISLWEVRDFPTACLMVQFYKYLLSGSTAHEALQKAQMWLKNITNKELKIWIRKQKLPLSTGQKIEVQNWLPKQQDNLYPFQHPYYWGAFYLIGA